MSDITRLFHALDRLGLITHGSFSEGLAVTVTNELHVTLALRSEKAIKAIVAALEAQIPSDG